MNFDFNPQEQELLAQVKAIAAEIGQRGPDDWAAGDALVHEALRRFAGTPYLRLSLIPTPGIGAPALMKAIELCAHASPSLGLSLEMSTRVFGRLIAEFGDETLKAELLEPLLRGETIGATALCEGAMNIENDPFTVQGEDLGETIAISGAKTYVVNALWADHIAVLGQIQAQTAIFIIDASAPGLAVGERLQTLGYEGAAISGITLDRCRIPRSRLIGPFPGKDVPATVRCWENQVLLGTTLGCMTAAFEAAKAYANTHISGKKPIVAYQEVAFKLAEMLMLCQTAQLLAYRAAWMSGVDPKEGRMLTDCAKVFVSESAEKVAGDALKILSQAGYLRGNPAERAYRCAKYGQIAGTSTEIARVKLGDQALGWN